MKKSFNFVSKSKDQILLKLLSSLENLNSLQSPKSLENVIYPMTSQALKTQILKRVNTDPLGPSDILPEKEKTHESVDGQSACSSCRQ